MESFTDVTSTAVPRPDPFENWDDMLAALPELEPLQEGIAYPRSAVMRFQERRVDHGQHPPANKMHMQRNGDTKRRTCGKCRNLLRKNKQLKRLVKILQAKLLSMELNQSTGSTSAYSGALTRQFND